MPKLVFFGCGGVGCALLEMLTIIPLNNIDKILIIDPRDISSDPIVKELSDRITHIQIEVTEKNLLSLLVRYVEKRDIVVDISYNIYFKPLVKWCIKRDILYINTSVERWPVEEEETLGDKKQIYKRSLYHYHKVAKTLMKPNTSTAVLEHGMNPGLISHFTKLGIYNVCTEVLQKAKEEKVNLPELEKYYELKDFARLAYLLGLETIHCSEKDTQVPKSERKAGEFMNTWGAYSFYAEGVDPVQLGFGTHESKIANAIRPQRGESNQIFLPIRGVDLMMTSYVPGYGKINGMAIPHGENETINRDLTVRSKDGKKVIYRPSQYYVYSPCQVAWDSINEVKKNGYKMLQIQKCLRGSDISTGEDAVGALLIFKTDPIQSLVYKKRTSPCCYWCGSILSIEQVREMGFRYSGPTVVQVAISLRTVIEWMMENRREGVLFPESLPYDYILERCEKWLGKIFSDWVPYHPETTQLKSFMIF